MLQLVELILTSLPVVGLIFKTSYFINHHMFYKRNRSRSFFSLTLILWECFSTLWLIIDGSWWKQSGVFRWLLSVSEYIWSRKQKPGSSWFKYVVYDIGSDWIELKRTVGFYLVPFSWFVLIQSVQTDQNTDRMF